MHTLNGIDLVKSDLSCVPWLKKTSIINLGISSAAFVASRLVLSLAIVALAAFLAKALIVPARMYASGIKHGLVDSRNSVKSCSALSEVPHMP